MTKESKQAQQAKGDKALRLLESGLSRDQIAERLAIRPHNVSGVLQRAKERRAKAEAAE